MSDQLHAPIALPQEKPRYPPNTRLGGPQDLYGLLEKRNISCLSAGIRIPDRPAQKRTKQFETLMRIKSGIYY